MALKRYGVSMYQLITDMCEIFSEDLANYINQFLVVSGTNNKIVLAVPILVHVVVGGRDET